MSNPLFGNYSDNPNIKLRTIQIVDPPVTGILYQNGNNPIAAVPNGVNFTFLRRNTNVAAGYDWVAGGGGGGVTTVNGQTGDVILNLSNINDVQITSIADGDLIKWNAGLGKWVNVSTPNTFYTTQTSDLTPTTIFTKATTMDTSYMITTEILGRAISGPNAGGTCAYIAAAAASNNGGTVTVKPNTIQSMEDIISCTVDIAASGTNIIVQVTGTAADVIHWKAIVNIIPNPPWP